MKGVVLLPEIILKTKSKKFRGVFFLKLDFEKAYDRVTCVRFSNKVLTRGESIGQVALSREARRLLLSTGLARNFFRNGRGCSRETRFPLFDFAVEALDAIFQPSSQLGGPYQGSGPASDPGGYHLQYADDTIIML
jgi:hypothetical protein